LISGVLTTGDDFSFCFSIDRVTLWS
jgi:hypothetical protein